MHGDNKTISLLVEKGAKRKWYVMYGLWIYREIKLKNRCAKEPFNKPEPNDLVNKIQTLKVRQPFLQQKIS